jgi:MFS family permease
VSLGPTSPVPCAAVAAKRTWRVGTLIYSSGSLATLYGWLLWGDFSWQLKDRTGPIVQVMLGKFKATDFLTALFMISLPAIVTMTIGPLVGYWSDNHRGKMGRRIPFLLVTTPIAGMALMGVGCGPVIGKWLHNHLGWPSDWLNPTVLAVMAVFWIAFEIATVTANTVFAGLINDVVPRELIGRFYGLFRIISLGVGILLFYYVMGYSKEHFLVILVALGAIYTVGFTLMCLKVKEGDYPPPMPRTKRGLGSLLSTIRTLARNCFAHPYYLKVFAFMALAVTSFIPINLYMVFAAEHFGLSLDSYGKYMALIFALSLVVAYPLGWMADRFHATRVGLGCLALYAVATGAGFFLVRGPGSFAFMLVAHGVLSVCYNTGVSALGQMLFPRDKFAQYAAAAAFMASLASVLASPLVGLLLDWLHRDYRYTFGLSCLLSTLALWLGLVMYRRFLAFGGPNHYIAPE